MERPGKHSSMPLDQGMIFAFWPRRRLWLVAILTVAVATSVAVRPAAADIDAEQVRSAIDRAVTYLKREQNPRGFWQEYIGYPGGLSALCTLALLNAGVPPEDEHIQAALEALRTIRPSYTYSTALQTMVFCAAEPQNDLALIRRNVLWLEENQVKTGFFAGGWAYPSAGMADNSNSQFAMLALYEAQRAGIPVQDKTWQLALEYWSKKQNVDGSWGYIAGHGGTGSMTTAGITSLIIATGALNKGDAEVVAGHVKCCGTQRHNDAVENALSWLTRNFGVHGNPGRGNAAFVLYYLYGVERVGRMTNRRFIGEHDWYREGADMLVRSQDKLEGFWRGGGHAEDNPLVGTSLSLLFLAKGRRPVLVAKLKHGPFDDWNRHRSDLANLTEYVEKKWKRDLTWQVIDPKQATIDDLLQSPVLFFNGREMPHFTAEEKRNLRDYVDRGGFIFAEACCNGTRFETGFRKLMSEVFPEPEFKMRLLSPEHPIWYAEEPVDPKFLRPLWGIELGCRTSVVFCPKDLSCYWELGKTEHHRKLPKGIQHQVDAANAIGINVLAYATNRELKFKYDIFQKPDAEGTADKDPRGKLQVAKLLHPGGCNAAPGAVTNLMRLASEKLKVRVGLEPQDVDLASEQVFDFPLVFMHGRHNFRLTPQERKHLRTYLDRGGVLFADAICSSRDFAEAFRREIKSLYPERRFERIPSSHPMFSREFGGENLASVSRRQRDARTGGEALKSSVREGEPYLEGLLIEDRYAVIFSPYDVSCALEHHESLECEGYVRQDAARIALNVLLYALHQ